MFDFGKTLFHMVSNVTLQYEYSNFLMFRGILGKVKYCMSCLELFGQILSVSVLSGGTPAGQILKSLVLTSVCF